MGSRDHSETCEVCGYQRGGMDDYECACASPGLALGARHGALIEAAERLSNLALCLRDAGALCAAWSGGFDAGWGCSSEGYNDEYVSRRLQEHKPNWYDEMKREWGDGSWRPGCGRTAGGGR